LNAESQQKPRDVKTPVPKQKKTFAKSRRSSNPGESRPGMLEDIDISQYHAAIRPYVATVSGDKHSPDSTAAGSAKTSAAPVRDWGGFT
jgi:hypothetical protein